MNKIKRRKLPDGRVEIFDVIRRQWLISTPEEQVRQQFIHYLINIAGFNPAHISIEHHFVLDGGKNLRADIVLFDKNAKAIMLIECKAESIKIDGTTFTQASKYNNFFRAKYILLTNGISNYIFSTDDFISYKSEKQFPHL